MNTYDYYTAEEVASFLRVSKQTVYFWIRTNQLRADRFGKHVRIPKDALAAFRRPAGTNTDVSDVPDEAA